MKINDMPVVDARRRLVVHIKEQDVKRGATKSPSSCAAALACVRETPCTEARVHLGRTYLRVGNRWMRYLTPASIRSEIIAFDRGAEFATGEFTLVPVSPASRLRRGRAQGSSTSKTRAGPKKPRAKHHVVHGVRQRGANR